MNPRAITQYVEFRHFHVFHGLGGGARGFNKGRARVGNLEARFRCIGGVDSDAAGVADFGRLAGVPGTLLDLFDREQYTAFHGKEPPPDWREASPQDLRRAAGGERPHIVFLSAPCKGFSGLLSEKAARSVRYAALNRLTLRGVWLMLEAWADDPPELIVFENVPRIATRGRALLDQITALLRSSGYAVAETHHDCGEIGNLAQSRKRFLLVARHAAKVPPFLYEPTKNRLRAVGEVLEKFPLPGDLAAGPMHRVPALQWKTWLRLAFVEAGSDWRSLNKLRIVDGHVADYGLIPDAEYHNGALGVQSWDEAAGTVTANGRPHSGTFSVADPRIDGHAKSVQMGVRRWGQTAGVVTGKMFAGGGPNSVADPRLQGSPRFNNTFRIVRWGDNSPAIAGPGGPAGGLAVADPRAPADAGYKKTKYRVTGMDEAAGAVIAASTTGNGAFAVADPRQGLDGNARHHSWRVTDWGERGGTVTSSRSPGSGALTVADPRPEALKSAPASYQTAGKYGVVPWAGTARAIAGAGQHDNGFNSVADPRVLPASNERLVCVIRALDDTWHRPFTTLDLAALQSLIEPEEFLELYGLSDSAWRERIGNAVPPKAAEGMANTFGKTLLMALSGQTFVLANEPIWVQPIAVALSVAPATALE
jgi:site-specific DNA-cytosine methylase